MVTLVTEARMTAGGCDSETRDTFLDCELDVEIKDREARSANGNSTRQILRLNFSHALKTLSSLPRSFYEPSASVVAPRLLGHFLIRETAEGMCGGAIVETEAYVQGDAACHAAPGLTKRNRVMFGKPGHGYIYLIYGFHFCMNAVCRPEGLAEAVLIRAVESTFGEKQMLAQRPVGKTRDLTNGPGKLCQAMNITRELDGVDLCNEQSELYIAENPDVKKFRKEKGPVITTTRIGITKAATLPLRFYLDASEFVSKR